uniref:Trafficking protein particle complex subunit 6B n=1 Tax=Oryza glumipatula TaxID=40148 RepID=A0A0E0B003_9ORYZ
MPQAAALEEPPRRTLLPMELKESGIELAQHLNRITPPTMWQTLLPSTTAFLAHRRRPSAEQQATNYQTTSTSFNSRKPTMCKKWEEEEDELQTGRVALTSCCSFVYMGLVAGATGTNTIEQWRLARTRYTMERLRFSDHLEAIKFICKDFWSELFKKQIDNLKTNHRGTFVLQDNRFRWLTRVSIDPSVESMDATDNDSATLGDSAAQTTSMLLYFPCGIIRGALTNLGISCSVTADMSNLPACSFVVRIKT